MMSAVLGSGNQRLCWSTLSITQRETGISPELLSELEFDIPLENWSPEREQQVRNFFAGCLLAASAEEYHRHVWSLINSSMLPLPVKAIAEKTLKVARLQEMTIPRDGRGEYEGPDFEGVGCGHEYCAYEEKFGSCYNNLINEGLAHLMHPARIEKLLNSGFINKDDILLAERLISYRCYGDLGFRVSEHERELMHIQQERDDLAAQLTTLTEPNYVANLREEDLYLIHDTPCRKYVCEIFNSLREQNKLHLLDLPENELYVYKCKGELGGPVHQELERWAKAYMKEIGMGGLHFGAVVKHLKSLAKGDLNALKRQCIDDGLSDLNMSIEFKEGQLHEAKQNLASSLSQLSTSGEQYLPGDFSFLGDETVCRILTNAYKVVEKLQAWSFFDLEPPAGDKGYIFCDHPMVTAINYELRSDRHTGVSMGFCMRWMQKIRKEGWSTVVNKSLSSNVAGLGMLELMRAKVNEIEIQDDESVPVKFLCPITGELIRDPVIAIDGHTYEKSALLMWLERNPSSPITRKPMTKDDFRPNYHLLSEIQKWAKK